MTPRRISRASQHHQNGTNPSVILLLTQTLLVLPSEHPTLPSPQHTQAEPYHKPQPPAKESRRSGMSQRQHRPSLLELCGFSKIKPKNKNHPSKQREKAELKIFSVEKNHRKLNCTKISSLLAESAHLTGLLLQNSPNTGPNFYHAAGVTTEQQTKWTIKKRKSKE